jgi:hypothetical protein
MGMPSGPRIPVAAMENSRSKGSRKGSYLITDIASSSWSSLHRSHKLGQLKRPYPASWFPVDPLAGHLPSHAAHLPLRDNGRVAGAETPEPKDGFHGG